MHSKLLSREQKAYGKLVLINAWPVLQALMLQSDNK